MKKAISVHRASSTKDSTALKREINTLRFDAERKGWAIVESFYTASPSDLPAPELAGLLSLFEAADASDVILAHVDRLRRVNERDFIRMVAVIEQAGVAVHVRVGS